MVNKWNVEDKLVGHIEEVGHVVEVVVACRTKYATVHYPPNTPVKKSPVLTLCAFLWSDTQGAHLIESQEDQDMMKQDRKGKKVLIEASGSVAG